MIVANNTKLLVVTPNGTKPDKKTTVKNVCVNVGKFSDRIIAMKKTKLTLAFVLFISGLSLPNHAETKLVPENEKFTAYHCHLANLFFEARGESEAGMKAVAKITVNRVRSKNYPSNTCDVVFQHKQFSWTHQQSWQRIEAVMNGSALKTMKQPDKKAYSKATQVAKAAAKGTLSVPKLKNSLHYHADYVKPTWSKKMRPVAKIGSHIFYEIPEKS